MQFPNDVDSSLMTRLDLNRVVFALRLITGSSTQVACVFLMTLEIAK